MLNAKAVDALKQKAKQYKVSDKDGLYILVTPAGGRLWRYKYRFAGKEKVFSFGGYPEVSLAEARKKHEAVRRKIRDGIDPAAEKRDSKFQLAGKHENTFENVFSEWHKRESKKWSPDHADRVKRDVELNIIPIIGNIPVSDLDTPALLHMIKKVEDRGVVDVAIRCQQRTTSILRYAVQHGLIKHNPSIDLKGIVVKPPVTHRIAVDEAEFGQLVRDINNYGLTYRSFLTRCALQLTMYTFLRSTEIRGARWDEFDFDASQWTVPGIRDLLKKNGGMKSRKPHIVPLSKQSLAILKSIRELDLSDELVFPISSGSKRVMSENTMNNALNKMGYKDRQTVHGLRTVASTILNKGDANHKWNRDAIERQLSHSPASNDAVRDAYNRYEFLDERVALMQWYADRLDLLAELDTKKVVEFKRA